MLGRSSGARAQACEVCRYTHVPILLEPAIVQPSKEGIVLAEGVTMDPTHDCVIGREWCVGKCV